jgi:RNA 3'-terminal phosphate cyclase (ATP)
VANGLVSEVASYLGKGRPVGPHMADQLMVPLAVLAGGRYATGRLSDHALTNLQTMAAFGAHAHAVSEGLVTVEALSTS